MAEALKGLKKEPIHEAVLHQLARIVVTLPRRTKRAVMLLADTLAMPVCIVFAAWLVTPNLLLTLPPWIWVIPLLLALSGLRVWGFYRSVVRFMGLELVEAAFKTITLVSFALLLCLGWADTWPDAIRTSATFGFSAWSMSLGAA